MIARSITVAAIAGAAATLFGTFFYLHVPMCPFAAATGVPCPGCGLTRASVAALSGHLGTALALQPFAFVVTPLFGTFAATVAFTYVKTGTATLPRRVERKLTPALYIVFISMISFWIARFFGVWGGPVPV